MKRTVLGSLVLGPILIFSVPAASAPAPIVVELYQSQGCSSCPPAIRNLNAIAGRPDILALTFAVTYWDYLGWKDTFAKPEFTSRQRDYARGLHRANVFTPQIVIDGASDVVGADSGELQAARARARALPGSGAGPDIEVKGDRVILADAKAAAADVWLVRYDPRTINVPIAAGENSGAVIAHRNVVRALVHLGDWNGAAQTYALAPGGDPAWRAAILVQAKHGGPILSAKTL